MRVGDQRREKKELRVCEASMQQTHTHRCFGAGHETRTRDPQLGKLMLYQLS